MTEGVFRAGERKHKGQYNMPITHDIRGETVHMNSLKTCQTALQRLHGRQAGTGKGPDAVGP